MLVVKKKIPARPVQQLFNNLCANIEITFHFQLNSNLVPTNYFCVLVFVVPFLYALIDIVPENRANVPQFRFQSKHSVSILYQTAFDFLFKLKPANNLTIELSLQSVAILFLFLCSAIATSIFLNSNNYRMTFKSVLLIPNHWQSVEIL